MLLSEFYGVLSHKAEWIMIGMVSSLVSLSIPLSNKTVVNFSGYELTGADVVFVFSTMLLILSVIKVGLALYESILTIRQKRRELNND